MQDLKSRSTVQKGLIESRWNSLITRGWNDMKRTLEQLGSQLHGSPCVHFFLINTGQYCKMHFLFLLIFFSPFIVRLQQ